MNIAFLISKYWPEETGGGGVSARLLAKGLTEIGHNVAVFAQRHDRRFEIDDGVMVIRDISRFRIFQSMRSFDILHVHDFRQIPRGHRYAKRYGLRSVVTIRDAGIRCAVANPYGNCDSCRFWRCALDMARRYCARMGWWVSLGRRIVRVWRNRRIIHGYDAVVFPSTVLARHSGIAGRVIANPAPTDWVPKEANRFSEKRPCVVYLGKLSIGKAVPVLLEAWPHVIAKRDATLLLVGRPTEQVEIPISRTIKHIGHVPNDDISHVYELADVIVSPSVCREGLSRTALEAGAAGVPIVCSDRGGTREAVVDGVTGRVVEANNPIALADGILDVLRKPYRMGVFGRKRMKDLYDPKVIAEAYEKVYRR